MLIKRQYQARVTPESRTYQGKADGVLHRRQLVCARHLQMAENLVRLREVPALGQNEAVLRWVRIIIQA
jgi:hypothetical protein